MLSLEEKPLAKAVFFDKEALLGQQHHAFERNCFEIFSYLEDSQEMQTYLVLEALAADGKKRYKSAIGLLSQPERASLVTMETRLNLTCCCSIEREAFVEPVRLSCHYTFNKEAVLQWHRINTRQPNCPECRHRLPVKKSRKLACKQPNEGVLARQHA